MLSLSLLVYWRYRQRPSRLSGLLLLLLICGIVHRSPATAVSCNITCRDGGAGRGRTRCVCWRRGIAIEDDVGKFEGKLFTNL